VTSQQPVANPGFESGAASWVASGSGTANAITNSGAAHSGTTYAQISLSAANTQETFYALLTATSPYLAVNPADIITFGGWAYRVSGDGKIRWGIEISDANKLNATYLNAPPANVTITGWQQQQGTYTIPTGKAFLRFYCQITGNTVASQANFDDALLVRTVSGGGYTYKGATPTITSISPAVGPTAGGTSVSVIGSNFLSGSTLTFGTTAATSVTVVDGSHISATTPAHAAGPVDVTLKGPDQQTAVLSNGFTFAVSPPIVSSITPSSGTSNGGTAVTIRGSGFNSGATVTVGGLSLSSPAIVNGTTITGRTQAHVAGGADVKVTNPDGQAATLFSTLYNQGFESGGTLWKFSVSGSATVVDNPSGAHNGTRYAELSSPKVGNHPLYYVADASGNPTYFPVAPGDSLTYGGWAYRVSGDGSARWAIELSDSNKLHPIYVAAPPANTQDSIWRQQGRTYTVPSGVAFVRLYAEIVNNAMPAIARFDDAILMRTPGTTGYTFLSPPIVTSVSPNWGAPDGGTTRTVYGTGLDKIITVSVGGSSATNVVVNSSNAVTFFIPPQSTGTVPVTVTGRDGESATLNNAYTYKTPPSPPPGLSNIRHIIFTFQENRSFDNYYGMMNQYRAMNGLNDSAVDGLNLNIKLQDLAGKSISPFHFQTVCHENTQPSWNASHVDYHNGLMDSFLKTGNYFSQPSSNDPTGTRAIGYYDWTDIPYYYGLAFQFAISDRFFGSMLGPTGANRAYSIAGTSLGFTGTPQPPTSGGFNNLTIFDLLNRAGISWRYYYQNPSPSWITIWSVYSTSSNNVVPFAQYFTDVQDESTFPQVVFIEENGNKDEHPKPNPGSNSAGQNIQNGVSLMKSIVSALTASPTWASSVFILSYDEGGGMYDHVPPPNLVPPDGYAPFLLAGDQPGIFNQAGFRVPLTVVSPWTIPHFVSHTPRDHTSILKLIETRFSLPPLTARDDSADNMMEFFNFQSPAWLIPPSLPAQPTNGVCDLSLGKAPPQQ